MEDERGGDDGASSAVPDPAAAQQLTRRELRLLREEHAARAGQAEEPEPGVMPGPDVAPGPGVASEPDVVPGPDVAPESDVASEPDVMRGPGVVPGPGVAPGEPRADESEVVEDDADPNRTVVLRHPAPWVRADVVDDRDPDAAEAVTDFGETVELPREIPPEPEVDDVQWDAPLPGSNLRIGGVTPRAEAPRGERTGSEAVEDAAGRTEDAAGGVDGVAGQEPGGRTDAAGGAGATRAADLQDARAQSSHGEESPGSPFPVVSETGFDPAVTPTIFTPVGQPVFPPVKASPRPSVASGGDSVGRGPGRGAPSGSGRDGRADDGPAGDGAAAGTGLLAGGGPGGGMPVGGAPSAGAAVGAGRAGGARGDQVAGGEPLPTLDDLLARRPEPSSGPAEMGWQARVRRLTGGLIAPAPGESEQRRRRAIASVQRSLDGPRTVVVINPKGGAHKTTATMLIAATFGTHRGGYTLAWDNNETRGTLGWRSEQAQHHNTAVNLLTDLDRFADTNAARVGDLDNYVRAQRSARFDVLASDEDAASAASIDAFAFRALHRTLSRFYRIMVVDTGNNMRASNWQAAIEAADQVVIVSTVREDTAQSAAWAVDALRATGHEDVVRRAVTVLSAPAQRRDDELAERLHEHFGRLTRAVLDVPYDPALVAGTPIDYQALSRATKEAWLHVTAAVAEGL